MKFLKAVIALAIAVTPLASAKAQTLRTIEFSGESIINKLDGIFRNDIMPKLIPYASIVSGCRGPIEHIATQVTERPSNPTSNDRGELTSGVIKEQWSLSMCEKKIPIYLTVEFLPSGQSTYELSAKPWPGKQAP